jgi:hypothetical protein
MITVAVRAKMKATAPLSSEQISNVLRRDAECRAERNGSAVAEWKRETNIAADMTRLFLNTAPALFGHWTRATVPTVLLGRLRPAAAQPPVFRISPVPLIVMLSTTSPKQEAPLLELLTAPLNSTLECGR